MSKDLGALSGSREPSPSGLGPSGFDPERFDELIAKLKVARGDPKEWIERENAVSRFIAAVPDTTRVFCRGEVRLDKGHFPAVLTFNTLYKQTLAWAPSGRKGSFEGHHEAAFYSNIPHVGIAREVLAGPETTAIVTEARREETPQSGSVHEGAGPQDIAPATPPIPKDRHDPINRVR